MTWRKFREEFWWLFANIVHLFGGYNTRLWWWFTHRTLDAAYEGYVYHEWTNTRWIGEQYGWNPGYFKLKRLIHKTGELAIEYPPRFHDFWNINHGHVGKRDCCGKRWKDQFKP